MSFHDLIILGALLALAVILLPYVVRVVLVVDGAFWNVVNAFRLRRLARRTEVVEGSSWYIWNNVLGRYREAKVTDVHADGYTVRAGTSHSYHTFYISRQDWDKRVSSFSIHPVT